MFGKNKKANQEVEVKETKTGFRAACSNFKTNVCNGLDKVTPGHGVAAGIGMVAGAGVVYGVGKMAQKRANAAECAAAADDTVEFTERRTR